jgi:hypothetical protein
MGTSCTENALWHQGRVSALLDFEFAVGVAGRAGLLQLWSLQKWLVDWDSRDDYTAWQPYRALTVLAAGGGRYLAQVLALLG